LGPHPPTPNPQSPIPNPHIIEMFNILIKVKINYIFIIT